MFSHVDLHVHLVKTVEHSVHSLFLIEVELQKYVYFGNLFGKYHSKVLNNDSLFYGRVSPQDGLVVRLCLVRK